jgi:hypothetical protein
LEAFFAALAAKGLAINLEKFVFAAPTLELLGHTISAAGSAPKAEHTAEILSHPPGYQTVALFSWYGELLPSISSQLRQGSEPFNRSPKGQPSGPL